MVQLASVQSIAQAQAHVRVVTQGGAPIRTTAPTIQSRATVGNATGNPRVTGNSSLPAVQRATTNATPGTNGRPAAVTGAGANTNQRVDSSRFAHPTTSPGGTSPTTGQAQSIRPATTNTTPVTRTTNNTLKSNTTTNGQTQAIRPVTNTPQTIRPTTNTTTQSNASHGSVGGSQPELRRTTTTNPQTNTTRQTNTTHQTNTSPQTQSYHPTNSSPAQTYHPAVQPVQPKTVAPPVQQHAPPPAPRGGGNGGNKDKDDDKKHGH